MTMDSFPCACYYYYDECMILIYCSETSNGEMAFEAEEGLLSSVWQYANCIRSLTVRILQLNCATLLLLSKGIIKLPFAFILTAAAAAAPLNALRRGHPLHRLG